MKKALLAAMIAVLAGSCVSYHVEREIDRPAQIRKMKNTGVIFRITGASAITIERFNESLSHWIAGHKKVTKLTIVPTAPPEISVAREEYDYFQQYDTKDDFQYHKAMGIIAKYTEKNRGELQKIMTDNALDSILIYEIQTTISPEMEFIDFGSVVVLLDDKFNVSYLDHQFDRYDVDETDPHVLKDSLLDRINDRLIKKLLDFNFIKKP